jgi:hypothetical protein
MRGVRDERARECWAFFFLPLLLLLLRLHRRGKKTLMPIQIFARSFLDSGPLLFESDASARENVLHSLP